VSTLMVSNVGWVYAQENLLMVSVLATVAFLYAGVCRVVLGPSHHVTGAEGSEQKSSQVAPEVLI